MNSKNIFIFGIVAGIILVSIGAFLKVQKADNSSMFLNIGLVCEVLSVLGLVLSSKKQ